MLLFPSVAARDCLYFLCSASPSAVLRRNAAGIADMGKSRRIWAEHHEGRGRTGTPLPPAGALGMAVPGGQARGLPLLNCVRLGRFGAPLHPQSWLSVEVGGCGAWRLSRWEPAPLPALAGPAASSGALRRPRQVAQRTGRRLGPLLDVPQHGDTEAAPLPSRCHPTPPHPALGRRQQRGGCRSIAATACGD